MKRKFNSFDGTETDTEDLKEAEEKFLIRDTFIKGTDSISMSKEEFKEELRKAFDAGYFWEHLRPTTSTGNSMNDFNDYYKENYGPNS